MSNMNLNHPNHIISLKSASIIASVDVRVWTATKQDKQSSQELTNSKNADDSAARVTQHLLADNATHKKLLNYRQTIYNWIQRRTYPWSGSQTLLPVVDLPVFMNEFKQHETAFNRFVDEFIAEYPGIVANIAFRMGDFFDRGNYPTPEAVKDKFGIRLYMSEVPEGDFRNTLSQDLADDLHANYSRQAEELMKEVMDKQARQLLAVMESISHCCDMETVIAKDGSMKVKRRKLYDTTIERALELCESFKSFNVTSSSELEQARFDLQKILADVDINVLRESDIFRVNMKNEVDEVLNKFRAGRVIN